MRRLSIWLQSMPPEMETDILFYSPAGHDVTRQLSEHASSLQKIVPRYLKGRLAPISAALSAYCELRLGKHDILFSMFIGADVAAWLALRMLWLTTGRTIKHAVHVAGSPVPAGHWGTWRGRLYLAIARLVYPRADKIIVISERLGRLLVDEYGVDPKRIEVIPISVRCDSGRLPAEKERNESETVFGIVSRLHEEKCVDHTIEALAKLRNGGVKARLEIFGDGDQTEALRERSEELGLGEVVHFHGWFENPHMAFRKMDCLLLSSHYEGTPRSILEAGCHGVPSIASNVGGIPDIVTHGKTGWLYAHRDIDELAALMNMVAVSPEELRRAGETLKEEIAEKRSVQAEISSLVRSLRSVAGQNES